MPDLFTQYQPPTVTRHGRREGDVTDFEQQATPDYRLDKLQLNLNEARKIARRMALAYPRELHGVDAHVGGLHQGEVADRAESNPRLGLLGRRVGKAYADYMRKTPYTDDYLQTMGPHYDPIADLVFAPWNNPAAMSHEYGHAIDFNRKGPFRRDLAMLNRLPGTTILREYAAWKFARDAHLRGAAIERKKWDEIKDDLNEIALARTPALGTYWGGTIGSAAGVTALAAGLAISLSGNRAIGIPVSVLLPGIASTFGYKVGKEAYGLFREMRRRRAAIKDEKEYKKLLTMTREQLVRSKPDKSSKSSKASKPSKPSNIITE